MGPGHRPASRTRPSPMPPARRPTSRPPIRSVSTSRPSPRGWRPTSRELAARSRSTSSPAVTPTSPTAWSALMATRSSCAGRPSATSSLAHDMGREHRIIAALAGTPVPVAPARGFCDDLSVNGAPFYVMDFVDGHVIRDREGSRGRAAGGPAPAGRREPRGHPRRHPRRRPRGGRAVGLRRHEGYIEPPAPALVRPVAAVETPAAARRRRRPRPAGGPHPRAGRRASSTATTGSTTHGRRRRPRRRRARLELHPRRPLGRRRPADGVLDRAGGRPVGVDRLGHDGARLPGPGRAARPLRRRHGSRPRGDGLLRRVRLLEAGLHPGGRVRPLSGRCSRRRTRPVRARRVQVPGRAGGGAGG